MAQDTLAMLTRKQRQLENGLKAADKLGETAKNKGFSLETLMALQLTMSTVGFRPPRILSNIVGYGTLGNGVAKMMGKDDMKSALDEFRQPDYIAGIKEKMGLNDPEKVEKNPLLRFVNKLLDDIMLSEGETTSKEEIEALQKQKAENQAKIDEITDQKAQEAEQRKLEMDAVKLEAAKYEREMAKLQVEKMKRELGDTNPTTAVGVDGSVSDEIINKIVTAKVAEALKAQAKPEVTPVGHGEDDCIQANTSIPNKAPADKGIV